MIPLGTDDIGRDLDMKVEILAQLYLLKSYPLSIGTIIRDITGEGGVGKVAIRQVKGDAV
jgi:hypothetical protein